MEWWRSGFVIVQSLYNTYYGNRLVPDWTWVKCLADVMLVCKKGKKSAASAESRSIRWLVVLHTIINVFLISASAIFSTVV
jgi:hypothetical protein